MLSPLFLVGQEKSKESPHWKEPKSKIEFVKAWRFAPSVC